MVLVTLASIFVFGVLFIRTANALIDLVTGHFIRQDIEDVGTIDIATLSNIPARVEPEVYPQ